MKGISWFDQDDQYGINLFSQLIIRSTYIPDTCSDDTGCSSPGDNPCRHHIGPVYFQMKCVRGSCHCAVDYHHVFPGHGSHGNVSSGCML